MSSTPAAATRIGTAPLETFHDDWAWDYSDMRVCADIATNEYYYHDFNSGWIGKDDMLTQALGAKGYELRFGMKNSYDYLCPGYKQDDKAPAPPVWDATQPIDNNAKAFGDLRLYEGFLKCLYTEGMIGGVAGYFSYPKGGFDAAFSPDKPPQYLVQMVILGRVHALFSHQEAFLRQGDLLPGPNKHAKVTDQPAYEFPTGKPNRRVLARKMPNQPEVADHRLGLGRRGGPGHGGDPRVRVGHLAGAGHRQRLHRDASGRQTGSSASGCPVRKVFHRTMVPTYRSS